MNFRHLQVIIFSTFMLTSCGVIPTQFMPNGYRYEDDTPLSSPQPSRPWTDEADHPDLDHLSDNTAAWQGAIYELISPLPAMLPPATTTFVLMTTPPAAVADTAFDHYLRQGLLSYGYKVDILPSGTDTVLVYNAEPLTNESALKKVQAKYGKEFINKDKTKNMYYLTLGVKGPNGKIISEQTSIAVLPYEKTEYARLPGLSYVPSQGRPVSKRPDYND